MPLLFFLHDLAPDEPVGHYLGGIDRTGGASPSRLQDLPDAMVEWRGLFPHRVPSHPLYHLHLGFADMPIRLSCCVLANLYLYAGPHRFFGGFEQE